MISASISPQGKGEPLPFAVLRVSWSPDESGDGEGLGRSLAVGEMAVAWGMRVGRAVGCDAGLESGVVVASEDSTSGSGIAVAMTMVDSVVDVRVVAGGGVCVGVSSPPPVAKGV